jgi:hypothetical protein
LDRSARSRTLRGLVAAISRATAMRIRPLAAAAAASACVVCGAWLGIAKAGVDLHAAPDPAATLARARETSPPLDIGPLEVPLAPAPAPPPPPPPPPPTGG